MLGICLNLEWVLKIQVSIWITKYDSPFTSAVSQRWELDLTWIGLDPDYNELFLSGFDPDCKSLQKFRIRTRFGLR